MHVRPVTCAESCSLCARLSLTAALHIHVTGSRWSWLRRVGRPADHAGLVCALCARQFAAHRYARASSLSHGRCITCSGRISHDSLGPDHSRLRPQRADAWSSKRQPPRHCATQRRHGVWRRQHGGHACRACVCAADGVGAAAHGIVAASVWPDRGALCGGQRAVGCLGGRQAVI